MRLTLKQIIQDQIEKDISFNRMTIYKYLERNKLSFKLLSLIDQKAPVFLKSLLCLFWGLGSFVRFNIRRIYKTNTFFPMHEINEIRSITKLLKSISFDGPTYKVKMNYRCRRIKVAKLFRLFSYILKKYPLYVCFRVSSLIFCYSKLQCLPKPPKGFIICSSLSPHNCAIYAYARTKNLSIIYLANGIETEPFFNKEVSLYLSCSKYNAKYLSNTQRHICRDISSTTHDILISISHPIKTIGIFLSGTVNYTVLTSLLNDLIECNQNIGIIIRCHPNLKTRVHSSLDFSHLKSRLEFSSNTLEDDILKADIVLAGNSSVHIDVLKQGKPSLYYNQLDFDQYDLFSFLQNSLIFEIQTIHDVFDRDKINTFYTNPTWSLAKDLYISPSLTESDKESIRGYVL